MGSSTETTHQRPQPHTNGHAANGTATVAVAKPPFVSVQNGWLKRMRGQGISIRLRSGEVLSGVLEADDSYTLALRIPGHAETALVYKHSIEVLVPATKRPTAPPPDRRPPVG